MKGRISNPELLTKFWAYNSFDVGVQLPTESVIPAYSSRQGVIFVDETGYFIYEGESKSVQSYLSKFSVWAAQQVVAQEKKNGKEKEKKGTSEIAPAISMTSNSVHGGDGAAGEVPNSPNNGGEQNENIANGSQGHNSSDCNASSEESKTAGNSGASPALESKKADDDSHKDSDASLSGQGSGSRVPDQTDTINASPRIPAAGAMKGDEKTGSFFVEDENTLIESGEAGSHASESNESNREDNQSTDMSAGGAEEKSAPVLSEKERSILFKGAMKGFGKSNPSKTPNISFGGQNGSLKDTKVDKQLVLQARRVFQKMIHGGEGEAGSRYSAKRFSTKIAGYLREPSVDDRRLEDGRPALLVMADTSGSMGNFSNEVLALGMAVKNMGGLGGDIVLVNQSNGYPLEVMVNNKIDSWDYYSQESEGNDKIIDYYLRLVQRHNIKAVVVAADWDGAWLYEALSKVVDIYWVDVYCCNYGDVRIRNISEIEGFSDFDKRRIHYADRCNTAKSMLSALSRMIRR